MNNKVLCTISFAVGAIIGSAASMQYFKKKYERIADEEIESVKEVFARREKELDEIVDDNKGKLVAEFAKNKPDLTDYTKILNENGYSKDDNDETVEEGEEPMKDDIFKPYVITPEEFGEEEGYDTESLTYYSDGVLTDDYDNPIKDVEAMIGKDSLTHFGEYEDDSVFVRNDINKTDYEILKDIRKYSEIEHDRMNYDVDDDDEY